MNEAPRELLLSHGGDRMSTDELIAILLGTRSPELARALLAHCGGIEQLARASPRELATVGGIGIARATRLAAAFHLGRRAAAARAPGAALVSAVDVFERLHPRIAGLVQEVFVVLALDVRNVVLEEIEVARGCLTGVEVHPREVFRPLIRCAAASAIVAHNHPSGDPRPSPEDVALTARLRNVGELVGIPLLDHVIVTAGGFESMADRGWA
jgi:DNA repair protein RadC